MTLEEALKGITDPDIRQFIQTMITNQNSYITKLETQLKETSKPATQSGVDEITAKYLEKNMRRDVIAEAEKQILSEVDPKVYEAVKPDFMEFLEKSMKKENTTVEFAVDAFSLVLGRCYRIKGHAVNNIGKGTTPTTTPTQQTTIGTNSNQVQNVQNILSNQPPIMTHNDSSAAGGLPNSTSTPIKNTRDAFASLKNRFNQTGGSRFQ